MLPRNACGASHSHRSSCPDVKNQMARKRNCDGERWVRKADKTVGQSAAQNSWHCETMEQLLRLQTRNVKKEADTSNVMKPPMKVEIDCCTWQMRKLTMVLRFITFFRAAGESFRKGHRTPAGRTRGAGGHCQPAGGSLPTRSSRAAVSRQPAGEKNPPARSLRAAGKQRNAGGKRPPTRSSRAERSWQASGSGRPGGPQTRSWRARGNQL